MQIEKIFGEIPIFQDIKMDKILFESSYPILFTCIEHRNIYLFICCVNNSDETKWIGTKTSYPNLIELLTNEITIRDAFANVTDKKFLITKKVTGVNFNEVNFWKQNLESLRKKSYVLKKEWRVRKWIRVRIKKRSILA